MLVTHERRSAPTLTALAVACLGLLVAAPLAAQDDGGNGKDQSVQQTRQEMRQIQQQIAQIQQKAMQDSAIRAEQMDLQQTIEKKMNDIDGKTSERSDRIGQLQAAMQKARTDQDTAKMRSLVTEFRQVQGKLQQTQGKAMQDSAIQAQLQAFRSDVISQMNDVDPKADSLINRLQELQTQVQKSMSGRSGGSGSGGGVR